MTDVSAPYVIVLAFGEDPRIAPLTRALYRCDVPKQFAVFTGERSLLQATIERAAALTRLDRISVVVAAKHERRAREQLSDYPGIDFAVQPQCLGTAPAVLLALARIQARAADARIIILPSDHHVANVEPLHRALREARHGALSLGISLVGVPATNSEHEHCWIVPSEPIAGTTAFKVSHFQDQPTRAHALQLRLAGGLWNTSIQTGPARVFWKLARELLPRHTAALEAYVPAIGHASEGNARAAAYRTMQPADLTADVLAYAGTLAVLRVRDIGWSDWGTPAKVFASIEDVNARAQLVDRICAAHAA